MKIKTTLLTAVTMLLLMGSCKSPAPVVNPYQEKMEQGMTRLVDTRDDSGIWMVDDIGWWNSANTVTAILRYAKQTGKIEEIKPMLADIFAKARTIGEAGDFINEFYDDEAWWLLAWVEAYDQTGVKEYLDMAEYIFTDLLTASDDTCGGGIYWKKPQKYKNAIANNLFNLSAARLYKSTGKETYKKWFVDNAAWFLQTGMIREDGMVHDGTRECEATGKFFTYNSGVAIAWLAELYLLTQEEQYLEKAKFVADAAMKGFASDKGVLRELREPEDLGNDGIQFKGIFMRHLGFLYEVTKEPRYKDFILTSANSIIENAYSEKDNCFGSFWTGPFDKADSKGHTSAWEAIIEAYVVSQ